MSIETADRDRSLFLVAFLASMLTILATYSGIAPDVTNLIRLCVVVFAMVATYRFARSIGMGTAAIIVNTVLAAVIMIVPLFVLLHYHRRYATEASAPATT